MKNTLSAFALGLAGALVGLTVATAPVEAATDRKNCVLRLNDAGIIHTLYVRGNFCF